MRQIFVCLLLSVVLIHSASLGAGVVSVDKAKTEADAFFKAKAFSRAVPVTGLTYVDAPSDKSDGPPVILYLQSG